jgi:predicted nucleotidyltransferase component of viral defense system
MDKQLIFSLSDQYGFQADVLEKIYRLTDLLKLFRSNPYVADRLALKGGTAINFLYFGFPRLSVDLDFDFSMNVPRDDMLVEKADMKQLLDEILSSLPYQVQFINTDSSLHYHLTYKNLDGLQDNIKLDINFRTRAHVLQPTDQFFHSPFQDSPIQVRALQPEEIFGQKLKALMERTRARDLYDAYNLVKMLQANPSFLNKELLHKIFIYYVCTANHDYRDLKPSRIDILEDDDIQDNLLPVLKSSDEFQLSKAKEAIYPFIRELLKLNDGEIDYINSFFDQAEYRPELLFPPPYHHLQHNVSSSPAIQWKLYNLKKHLGKA